MIIMTFNNSINAQSGLIAGKVTDATTSEPLIGANIVVNELPGIGTVTDPNGNYKIKVAAGSYSIKVSLVGYTPSVKTDVIVRSGDEAIINIKLQESALQLQQVVITADYFDKATIENDLSTVVLGPEEVKRSPGSSQDFQRILQGMAGVSFSNDQTNELLVRGGSPNENLVVFDNIEIHSTNHYPNEYNSGGPINMINVDLVDDIQFSTGGFISKYGDKLSSVMVVNTREGSRIEPFRINSNLSMAGFGAVMEGRINDGKGSWILSARKSYINLIAISFGLTSIPYYYDLQYKVAYDLSNVHKLSLSGIYGNDKIHIEGVSDFTDDDKKNVTDTIDVENVNMKGSQFATGLTLKSIWTNRIYSIFTVSLDNTHNDVLVKNDFTQRRFDYNGKLEKTSIQSSKRVFQNYSDLANLQFKGEFVWNISKTNELNFGGAVKTNRFTQTEYISGDTARYDINRDGQFNSLDLFIVRNESSFENNFNLFDQLNSYVYVNDKLKLFEDRLILNLGLRYDYLTYSKAGNISPRISTSFYIVPDLTSISFSYGEYYQMQNYPTYGDRYNSEINRFLKNSHARHFVLGIEQILDDGLKFSVEGYYKQYSDLPIEEEFINFNDRTFRSEKRLNIGRQKNYGIDLLVQQKLVKDLYGTIAFSRSWTKMDDPRKGYEGKNFPSDYDFPYVLTLIVGKRFKDLRQGLDDMPFYIKYPTYILPFSDDMEISVRWRYASGKPYTPRTFVTYEQHIEGGTKWSDGAWIRTDNINGGRYPDYSRLDLGFNSRYNFSNWSLSLFLSIQNLYNRKNIAAYSYNSDGTIDNVYQFSVMPIAGIEIDF